MEDELLELQRQLNSENFPVGQIYRRNEINYPLVCYANIITGCYISENYKTLVVFIDRARQHMEHHQEKPREQGYYLFIENYLNKMEKYLESKGVDTAPWQ